MTAQLDMFPGEMPPERLAVLERVDTDHRRDYDRWLIDQAVRRVAMRDGGIVSNNAVRRQLVNADGDYTVLPQAIGARIAALTRQGVLEATGALEQNDDKAGGNSNKWQPVRRWVREP